MSRKNAVGQVVDDGLGSATDGFLYVDVTMPARYLPSLHGNAARIALIIRLGANSSSFSGWSRRYIIVMFIICLLVTSGGKQNIA